MNILSLSLHMYPPLQYFILRGDASLCGALVIFKACLYVYILVYVKQL